MIKEKLTIMIDSHQPHQAAFCLKIGAHIIIGGDMAGLFSAAVHLSWSRAGSRNMSAVMLTGTWIL